ncbi:MAG: GNAT family N-acetyltransferase [bacterium]
MPEAPSVRVVPVQEADLEAVTGLVNRAFSKYSDIFKGSRTSPGDYLDEVGEDARVILVEDAGRLVASGMIAPAARFVEVEQLGPAGTARPGGGTGLEPDHPWAGALYFGLAGVEPEIMNRGLGRLLVGHVERIAREEGFPAVGLGTLREFGLVEYYEKLDYTVFHKMEMPAGHWDIVVPHLYCEMVKRL